MEKSKFEALCRAYISSLCVLALAVPLITDAHLRGRVVSSLGGLAAPAHKKLALYEELDRNRVRLASDLDQGVRPSSSMSSIVVRAAAKHRLDPALIRAVIHVESRSNSFGISPKGARGVMQLMPATARRLGVENIHDPAQNIFGGTKYLRNLLDMFGNDLRLALAAYNAGPGAVKQYNGVPPYPETHRYINKVMTAYRGFRQVYS